MSDQKLQCKDCGRDMPMATNADTTGWVTAGCDTFCPNCLRLATVEKRLLETKQALVNLAKHLGVGSPSQPTPVPEPPTYFCINGCEASAESCKQIKHADGSDNTLPPCPNYRQPITKPAPTIRPEASQPLPAAEWEQLRALHAKAKSMQEAIQWTRNSVTYEIQWLIKAEFDKEPMDADKAKAIYAKFDGLFDILEEDRQRLAALWPKAGQVPSVTEYDITMAREDLLEAHDPFPDRVDRVIKRLLSRMGQPSVEKIKTVCPQCGHEHPAYRSYDWMNAATHYVAPSVQPSPTTAEKLARFLAKLNAFEYDALGVEIQSLYDGRARRLLQAFPTLGPGRLTRDAVKNIILRFGGGLLPIDDCVSDLLALQGPMTVSKERWRKLCDKATKVGGLVSLSQVKAWLKDELGMEVEE